MKRIKTLIHVHTDFSYDSNISVRALAKFLEAEHFGCVAVTDHDTIEGALRLRTATNVRVIIGEEVTTRDGHLIGLFLRECVRPGMSALDTARAIHEQGGLVFLPHPFVTMFSCGLGDTAWRMAQHLDAVEVFNAQNMLAGPDQKAVQFAERYGLHKFVGSDSHSVASIAPAFQTLPNFDTHAEFLHALRAASFHTERHPLSYFAGAGYRTARHLLGLPLPYGFGAHYEPVDEQPGSRAAVAAG